MKVERLVGPTIIISLALALGHLINVSPVKAREVTVTPEAPVLPVYFPVVENDVLPSATASVVPPPTERPTVAASSTRVPPFGKQNYAVVKP